MEREESAMQEQSLVRDTQVGEVVTGADIDVHPQRNVIIDCVG